MRISKEAVVTCERTFDKSHFNFLSYKLLMHREYMALHAVFNRIVKKWNWRMPDLKVANQTNKVHISRIQEVRHNKRNIEENQGETISVAHL